MPTVEVQLRISAAPESTWKIVSDIDSYPQYMSDVRSDIDSYPQYMSDVRSVTTETDAAGSVRRSNWSVSLRGSILEWTERDHFDDETMRIEFEQVDGDLDRFAGYWQIVPVADQPDASDVRFFVDFDIGIPLLADMLNPVAETSLRNNALRMLAAVQERTTETV